jgi:hypothetical protein
VGGVEGQKGRGVAEAMGTKGCFFPKPPGSHGCFAALFFRGGGGAALGFKLRALLLLGRHSTT